MQPDEVRPITVLFADLVGSTGVGERLRPDEAKALVGECVSRMSAAAEAYGGFVQAYQGDGICVFYGVPAAHEDDPERAALAALDILDVVADSRREIEEAWGITHVSVRVGLNTGTAAVGPVGAGAPHPVAVGDVTNTAARLEGAADPGTILVGPETANRLAARFHLESAGRLALKGKQHPVEAWRLVAAERETPRTTPGPLVGRHAEADRVRLLVDDVRRGRGQVLALLGGAGIGKTHLIAEVRRGARVGDVWIRGRACPHTGATSYAALVDALRAWLEVGVGDPPILVRTRLRARTSGFVGEECRLGLEALLGVAGAPSPIEQRSAILRWIEALAERAPLVLVMDDLQWIDRPTRDVIEGILALTERLPLLAVLCMRPEPGSEGWSLRMHALAEYPHRTTDLSIGPLAYGSATELARTLLPDADVATHRALVEEAEGNPLYLEELARGVAENTSDRRRSWTISVRPAAALPSTLQSLMLSRIDRLPVAPRRLLQAAAVLGKSFPVGVLQAMVVDEQFEEHLRVLLRAEVIREARRFPTFECAFSHGLLQEAVLATLPAARQRELYAAAAQAVEEHLGDDTVEHLELLAECHARSGDLPRAREYFTRAQGAASEAGATDRAAEYGRRAEKVSARLQSG